ncbi:hypothetical protein CALVIDRAFT_564057 [Calocera viscosa TUFC12733]|uniref:Uncharacterized protein n=1 Tax=Calocera viscosa (strain TUFC12733) TaxID=1330018 RepID=A0A167LYR6_CALVF|nr:hypothetical protein CALVIDRAFT_564057 [Calocera viscosa TUFC12733]
MAPPFPPIPTNPAGSPAPSNAVIIGASIGALVLFLGGSWLFFKRRAANSKAESEPGEEVSPARPITAQDDVWRSGRPNYWSTLEAHLAPRPQAPAGRRTELEWHAVGPNGVGARRVPAAHRPAGGGRTELQWQQQPRREQAEAARERGNGAHRPVERREATRGVVRAEGDGEQPPSYLAARKDPLLAVTMVVIDPVHERARNGPLPPVYEAAEAVGEGGQGPREAVHPLAENVRSEGGSESNRSRADQSRNRS